MSSGKKQQKKRKRQSPPPPLKSQIARRLEKLRGERRDLWEDDDDDDEQTKTRKNNKVCIVLSDSDEERPSSSSRRQLRSHKSRKKTARIPNESVSSDNTNATCLICSVLSQLSSYNCCAKHLSALKNHRHHQQQTTTNNSQWLPQQVMIVPVTDEIVQRYLDPQQIHHARTQTSTSPTNKKTSERNTSTHKSTMTLNLSEVEQPIKKIQKSCQVDIRPSASSIIIESTRSNSATIPPDITLTTVDLTSENPTNQLEESSTQTITIDDSQTNTPKENILLKANTDYKQIDPWIPISDEIDAALEVVLDQIDSASDNATEFTPTTARRTDTAIMAARLPKIPLKQGRFRLGKPIVSLPITNAANEYRPLAASSTSLITMTSARSPPTVTNVENESSVKPSSCQISNQSDNTTDTRNDIFTEDVASKHNDISTATLLNEASAPSSVINENSNEQIEIYRSNETQDLTPSTTNERTTTTTTTPARVSFRLNPDGTRVSISRPPLATNPRSPLITSLRRTSTDVSPIVPNTKQM